MRLKDKVAIVTGAAHGIGLAIARRYVAEGARVTIADVDAAAGEAAARTLAHARFVATDVGEAGNADNVVAETCRAFGDLDILVKAGKGAGTIINMSSINAVVAIANHTPYCVSKGGIDQLTKVMALALAPYGIRVNAIGPGSIMTDILKAVATDKEAKRRILARTPLGRIGAPDEIASIAVFLASEEASYITGETIYADGGRLALNYTVPVEDKALE